MVVSLLTRRRKPSSLAIAVVCKCQYSLLTVLEVDTRFRSCLANCAWNIPMRFITVVNRGDRSEEIFRDNPDESGCCVTSTDLK